MHSPHATWETSLVIPETAKPIDQQTLDALLRIEELLTQLLGQRNVVTVEGNLSDLITDITPSLMGSHSVEQAQKSTPKPKKTK